MSERAPQPTTTEAVTNLITILLAPMFLIAGQGDIRTARLAAFATVQNYRAQADFDVIIIGKFIAFSLAALSALSLAMTDDIGVPRLLRLQGSANACDRAAERNRRALNGKHRAPPPEPKPEPELSSIDEADVIARAQQAAVLAGQARQQTPEPARPEPAQPEPAQPAPEAAPQQAAPRTAEAKPAQSQAAAKSIADIERATWATACATVAQEFAAELPHLPPAEKWAASMRSKALSSVATDLLNGIDLQPYRFKPSTA